MYENKKENRDRGDHLERKEIKIGIIEFLLGKNEDVPEPEIREFLRDKYRIIDQGNIKEHLSDLQNRPYSCIEKITAKPGFANKWNIKKTESLRKISHYFSEVQLNNYVTSLNIVLRKLGYDLNSPSASILRAQLSRSRSFFETCLNNDIETLYAMAYNLSKEGEGSEESKLIKKYNHDIYTEFMKKILADPNLWLAVYSESINDPLKSEIYQNFVKIPQHVEISERSFLEMMKKTKVNQLLAMASKERTPEERYQIAVASISLELANKMIYHKIFEEKYGNFLKMPKQVLTELLAGMLQRLSEEIYNRLLMDDNWEEKYPKILKIRSHYYFHRLIGLNSLFNHYFTHDIIIGNVPAEEKKFLYESERVTTKFLADKDKDLLSAVKDYEKFFDKDLKKVQKKNEDSI